MLTFKELLSGHNVADVPIAHQHNLETLLICVNLLREAWAAPLTVTSGYRSMQDQLRIYSQKGITDPSKIPLKSKHLFGQACDFSDSDGSLYSWTFEHQDKLTEWGIWCELDTKGWLHCQCVPYSSYTDGASRFFIP